MNSPGLRSLNPQGNPERLLNTTDSNIPSRFVNAFLSIPTVAHIPVFNELIAAKKATIFHPTQTALRVQTPCSVNSPYIQSSRYSYFVYIDQFKSVETAIAQDVAWQHAASEQFKSYLYDPNT